ncbi:uncharacterized protein O3C94_016521 [Discoglossus pictus]
MCGKRAKAGYQGSISVQPVESVNAILPSLGRRTKSKAPELASIKADCLGSLLRCLQSFSVKQGVLGLVVSRYNFRFIHFLFLPRWRPGVDLCSSSQQITAHHLTKSSVMNRNKKMSERILHHILEILSLLTGKVLVLESLTNSLTVIEVNQDKEMSERILSHALEIIYLLTGDEYTIVKKKSPHTHQLTGECDIDGHNETLGISSNGSSGLQSDSVDTVSEEGDEMNEKDILLVTIGSELAAGYVRSSVVSQFDQEPEPDVRNRQHVKEEKIPVKISEDVSMTTNMCEEQQISLLSLDCVREDVSVSQACMDGNKSCVKQQTGETSFIYSDCGKGYTRNANLTKPKGVHTGENLYGFSEDEKCFSTPIDPNSHKRLHTEEQTYVCSECGKCFKEASSLNSHKKTHTGEKSFPCSVCGKCFSYTSHLNVHMRTHTGERPYLCSECGDCFSKASHLNVHKRTHTGERPFACSECDKCFRHALSLNIHKKTHTGERPFSCSECGKCFGQRSHLNLHKQTHTQERPFSCSDCGKCFSRASTLNAHKRTHTGERPFLCSDCGKCFSRATTLNDHKRTHTGERPFACSVCGKCFSQTSTLMVHKKTHTGE